MPRRDVFLRMFLGFVRREHQYPGDHRDRNLASVIMNKGQESFDCKSAPQYQCLLKYLMI
jgi:hypothetical protein